MSTIRIQKISITDLDTDIIVNAANSGLWAGGGVCGAIFSAAGHQKLQAACDKIGHCNVGSAVITPAFALKAKYIVHAVGPQWKGGTQREPKLLYSAYEKSLELAMEYDCHSIGFPLISAGIFGYPLEGAWRKAIQACGEFIERNPGYPIDIVFAVLDDTILAAGNRTLKEILPSMAHAENAACDKVPVPACANAEKLSSQGASVPHKADYYTRYDINWLTEQVKADAELRYVTFWKADEGEKNNIFSQWYQGKPIVINGRKYDTAEQYMMSEKALLFGDLKHYQMIMDEPSPKLDKDYGRDVYPFDSKVWDGALREIVFHGSLGKFQSDKALMDALLETGNAVLIEASPFDDIYGVGLEEKDLLNPDGSLKVPPDQWHKKGETRQALNTLRFILMGVRDLFRELTGTSWRPGEPGIHRLHTASDDE